MAKLTLGYKPGSRARGAGELHTGLTRITYLGKTTQPLWVIRGGIRMGKNQSATAWGAPVMYGANTDTPTSLALEARTNTLAVTVTMTNDRSTGHNYEADVQTPKLIPANRHLWGGGWSSSGDINFGQDASGALMRTYDGSGGAPTDPISTGSPNYSSAPEGQIDTWWIFETNAAPNAPTVVSPPVNGMTSEPSPDIVVKFTDPNAGDSVSKWLIELYDSANSTLLYTSGVKTAPTGVSGDTITWNPGVITPRVYTARAYTWDQGNAKSVARTWKFTVNAGGTITNLTLAPPVGLNANGDAVYNDTSPDWVSATWTHGDDEDGDIWTWRIVNADTGAVVRPAVDPVALNVPSGGMAWPNFVPEWGNLPEGPTRYAWEVQVTDALGGITPWTRSPAFVINAPPVIASSSPPASHTMSERPELSVTITDATDEPGTHTVAFTIVGKGTFPGDHHGGGVYTYQTTPTDLPAPPETFSWAAQALDPWGRVATLTSRTMNYVEPPDVTITAPTGTISTGSPTITATADRSLSEYRVLVTVAGTDIPVMDTDLVSATGASISEPVPAGHLRNNTNYQILIEGTAADGLTFSVVGTFRLEYIPEPALDDVAFSLEPSSVFDEGDIAQAPNAHMSWGRLSEADIDDIDFIGYVVYRYDGNGFGREWLIRNREVTAMVDRSAGHGVHSWFIGYRHYVNAGADVIDSELVRASAMVEILAPVITHEESDLAVSLPYWRDRDVDQNIDAVGRVPLGRDKPYGFQSRTNFDTVRGTFVPLSALNEMYDADQMVEAARSLAAPEIRADGTEGPQALWWRDPRKRAFRFMFTRGVRTRDQYDEDASEIVIEGTEVAGNEVIPMNEPVAVSDVS